ncbi:hypothetical protein Vadar_023515 [Vaccinium darrowii]|uniref:Uncharacterized protein n=1 Tax=Vaccinium darrowii TaxID=229202 RepID=A0ACB7X3V4_9ERIC|nr:hypothetical protein Vadar_023515 [Vaccinium darrowii]
MGVEKARGYLLWYVDATKAANLTSVSNLESDENQRFTRLFVGYDACKYGFNFCRLLLFVDATFLKGTHKGCVLATYATDGNQGLLKSNDTVFPSEPHSYCIVHLKANLGKAFGKCMRKERHLPITELVDKIRSKGHEAKVWESYSECINPIRTISKADFIDIDDNVLLPPLSKRHPGRPRTQRIPSTSVLVRTVKCGRCGMVGHRNRGTCKEPLLG